MKDKALKKMTIGTLAKEANVGVETVRFYERKGIIDQPVRLSGFRSYPKISIQRIRFVKKMQDLGFGLEEIKEFLAFTEETQDTSEIVQNKTQKKILEIQQKVEDLNRVLQALDKFASCCGKENTNDSCELLVCFENNWNCC